MAKSPSIETILARLAALKLAPSSPEAAGEVRAALTNKVDYVVERAAEFVREFKLPEFAPDLARAFLRLASQGNRGFGAYTALAGALHEMKADVPEVYLAGIHMFGAAPAGGIDPASPLRGICAMALVHIRHPKALLEATDLLVDKHVPARVGAVRALALSCEDAAALVLRLKLHVGDKDAEVFGEILSALIQLDPQDSLPLVAGYLDDRDDAIAEAAAFALGQSRRPEALKLLSERLAHTARPEARRPLLLAISITRLPDATELLLSQLASTDVKTAEYVLEALRIYRLDDSLREKVREIVGKRGDASMRVQFEKLFL